ncbi:sigma-70 family RNA polymerase sigma factor [Rhodanobacter denitrificans]|jgi:RNA polymerase sigma-70 factor (ECF subfamily)|uniref:RNA polymerase subunit sigma-24 n=2 Tax=Rhodanobacter TaxID=75309 RepID=A0A154QJR5_9GAMM|nr:MULTISPECIES: sigma-70 family RNA polymerase sigma factor [Rhodanobacter]AGG87779.1 RNA polymerase sigma factor, sigma-70 family [Rhodanobacter denitrificans]EIM02536.1 RNA polymerase ECF-type sigma factor [Rhodanobacter denitrificans]KZC24482.1 RNA polymerase subunit sigma-24 [Rhodanobacter thiooxydans]UJM86944.1 sigma-70 family RNA polymerase sigma factor [Rhodanobacter denitrificans]UJM90003.1 sigma-70 family RNA polymerase sigma factor [Rhodanobacter denitrificans]
MSPASTRANDSDDVRAAAAGDRHAFQRLYRLHVGRVHGAVYRLAGYDHARAEDLTQDAFVRAWQKLPGFRHESAFGTWLYRLAVNVALMDIRARGADPVSMLDDEHLPDTGETPFCAAEREELERAIGSLPPRARAVLVLHDIEGWRHEEIGSELGMAIGTSKAQLHRARGLLRKLLGECS